MPAYRWNGASYIDMRTGLPLTQFVLGTTMPTSANTGLNADGVNPNDLQIISGTYYNDIDNRVFENVRFTGAFINRAKSPTFKNVWFNGPHTSSVALFRADHANSSGIYAEKCLFQPSSYAPTYDGALANLIFGHKFILNRCDLMGAVDLIGLYSGVNATTPAQDVQILGCHMDNQLYYSPFPSQSDNRSHSDGIQSHYGLVNFLMDGTYMSGLVDPTKGQANDDAVYSGSNLVSGNPDKGFYRALSGIIFSPRDQAAGHNNIKVRRSWLGGGSATMLFPSDLTWGVDIAFEDNRWLENPGPSRGLNATISAPPSQPLTITGNVRMPSGTAYNGRVTA